MGEIFRKVFKIHKGEEVKVLLFVILGALIQAGVAIGLSLTDTLFLIRVGPEKLPIIYLIMPFMMLVYTPINNYMVSRYGIYRVFLAILALLVIGGGTLYFFVAIQGQSGSSKLIFYVAKLYTFLWLIGLYTIYWTFIDNYFDILDAKRLYPLFNGGLSMGAMVGGSMVSILTRIITAEFLFLVWSALALLTIPMLIYVKKKTKEIDSFDDDDEEGGFIEESTVVLKAIKNIRYVLLINLVMFGTSFLATVCEFQYLEVFSGYGDMEKLASLFGQLFAAANGFNLIVNFFLFNRMVSFFGVRNMTFIQPFAYLFTFLFFLYDYGFNSAIFGFFAYQGIFISLDLNNWNFVFNGVPSNIKTKVRTFTENLCDPTATACAGLFLLIKAPEMSPQRIALTALSVSIAHVLVTFLLRNDYLNAMVTNLRKEWLDFSKPEKEAVRDLDIEKIKQIGAFRSPDQTEIAAIAIHLLILKDKNQAIKTLLRYLENPSEKKWIAMKPLLENVLAESDTEIIRELLLWFESRDITLNSQLIELLGGLGLLQPNRIKMLLDSDHARDKGAMAIIFWNSWDICDGYEAMGTITKLLKGVAEEKKVAIHVIGKIKQERYAHFLVDFLKDPDPEIRREALLSIRNLVTPNSGRLIPGILQTIAVSGEEDRIVAGKALEKIQDSSCIVPLLDMSDTFSPYQRRITEKLILSIGLKSVPTMVKIYRSSQYSTYARSLAGRALSKLSFPQFDTFFSEIIHRAIRGAYYLLYSYQVLKNEKNTPGLFVLSGLLMDIHIRILEFCLELFTIGGRMPDFELMSSSLRSNNPKIRANAIEAVEQGISQDMFKILLPLVDSRSLDEKVSFYRQNFDVKDVRPENVVHMFINSKFSLDSTIAAEALWELNKAESVDIFRNRLREIKDTVFRDTVISLLSERDKNENKGRVTLNIVQRISLLSQSSFFHAFSMEELSLLIKNVYQAHYESGRTIYQPGDQADNLYCIIKGKVLLKPEETVMQDCDIFGEWCLFGNQEWDRAAISQGADLLIIPKEQILFYAKLNPRIAIKFLKNRLMMS
ncbi:MAG: hypothetical protein B6244_02815 [Candidatus Cloacimonetes bacterium 4572_55]|nr:MAG: hypothetical protein B6244_02815 [Candidatus Cloacimonetes bacterium 4572_55]